MTKDSLRLSRIGLCGYLHGFTRPTLLCSYNSYSTTESSSILNSKFLLLFILCICPFNSSLIFPSPLLVLIEEVFQIKSLLFFLSSSHLYFRHPLQPALTGASHPSCVWSPMISDQWVLMCFWSAWSTISPLTSDIAHHLSFSYSTTSTTYISSLTYVPAARSVLLTTWSEGRIIDRIAAFSPNYQYLEYWLPQKALTPH